jgi:hypothetical protein
VQASCTSRCARFAMGPLEAGWLLLPGHSHHGRPQFVIHPCERPTWMDAYVIQHGIRWTGMPSFQTLSDADVWHLALYVEGQSKPRE